MTDGTDGIRPLFRPLLAARSGSHVPHVVITGASSGLGAALARTLSRQGYRLTLFARDQERLSDIAGYCRAQGCDVQSVACDVTDAAGMRRALLQADDRAAVDLVIANAGLGGHAVLAPPAGEDGELARRIIDVNLTGVFNTVIPLTGRLVERRRGHIVLISSMAAFRGLPDSPVYAASKAAVRVYGQGLRQVLARHGVKVTVVCPGFIETPMSASLPFKTPFMWSAEAAAARIAKGIARAETEVIFPWQLHWASRVIAAMPDRMADRLLAIGRTRMNSISRNEKDEHA